MLLYHPAFDPYHGVFRLLQLFTRLPKIPFETEKIRILDFYLIFPENLNDVRLPKEYRSFRKTIQAVRDRYNNIENPVRIFHTLEPYQRFAINILLSYRLIESDAENDRKIFRSNVPLPTIIAESIRRANEKQADFVNFLTGPLSGIDLYGDDGLKARTKLFEYKYDPPTH